MEQQGREGECGLEERADQIQNLQHFLICIYPILDDKSKFSQTVPFFIDIALMAWSLKGNGFNTRVTA